MKALDIMTSKPEIVSPTLTLKQASELMLKKNIGFLPVGENDRLIGAITDRDIVIRGVALGKDLDTLTVRDVMTDEIEFCFENDSLDKVAEHMSNCQIRRLAVLNEGKRIVGVISLGDLATKSHDAKITAKVTEEVSEAS